LVVKSFRYTVFTAICFLALSAALVHGQAPSARAYVTPSGSLGVGQQFVLNVEIGGTRSIDRNPQLPDLTAFAQFLGTNSQSIARAVNGQAMVSLTVQYRYQALRQGAFEIPAMEVAAGGQTFTTVPLDVTITTRASDPEQRDETVIGPDDLFITAESSRSSVREGEPFVVEYRIWTRVDVTNFGMTSVPEPEGFWVVDATPGGPPVVEQLTREGVEYASAVIRRVVLVPTGAGDRSIEPIELEAQVRVRGGRDPFQDIFGRSSRFGSTTVPTTVLSNRLTVAVAPLPAGRREPFSGVVGRLDIVADLDRDSLDANDAVTLTIRVEGEGNLSAVAPPSLDLPPDFEMFPPEVSELVMPTSTGLSGSKTFEYVLIPRAPGAREIPSVSVNYFDRTTETYRTAETGALSLTVSGTALEGPGALARGGVAQLREDIRFIRLGPLDLRRVGGPPLVGPMFWLLALLPLTAVAGAVTLRRHWDLLEGDAAYARGRRSGRLGRKRLAEARRLSTGDDARAFYAEVAQALLGLVADRLNLPEAGLQIAEVDRALDRAGVDERTREGVRDCLQECDRHRFAPEGADQREKNQFLTEVGDLMSALIRAVK
jgi:hypothetical protein